MTTLTTDDCVKLKYIIEQYIDSVKLHINFLENCPMVMPRVERPDIYVTRLREQGKLDKAKKNLEKLNKQRQQPANNISF